MDVIDISPDKKPRITICLECKHHCLLEDDVDSLNWYDHLCSHPAVRRHEVVDFVTGEIAYKDEQDMGLHILYENPEPPCRDINTDGDCDFFQAKED